MALLCLGVGALGWAAWQYWGTNWQARQRHDDGVQALREGWSAGKDEIRTARGEAEAILHVPAFEKDYAVPILHGSSDDVLAAGVGHLASSVEPGERGNYVLAGHRVTHGEPFKDLPSLDPGDIIYVETRSETHAYVIDVGGDELTVSFTDTWVLADEPQNPAGTVEPPPGNRELVTLVTCSELFHTEERSVIFGHLLGSAPTLGAARRLGDHLPPTPTQRPAVSTRWPAHVNAS